MLFSCIHELITDDSWSTQIINEYVTRWESQREKKGSCTLLLSFMAHSMWIHYHGKFFPQFCCWTILRFFLENCMFRLVHNHTLIKSNMKEKNTPISHDGWLMESLIFENDNSNWLQNDFDAHSMVMAKKGCYSVL